MYILKVNPAHKLFSFKSSPVSLEKQKTIKKNSYFFLFGFSVIKTHSLTLATKEYMYRMHIEDVHVLMWQLSR
jgi:hypothetical protein